FADRMFSRILLFLFSLSSSSSRIINYAGYQLDDMAICELGWPISDYNHYGCACSLLIRLAAVDQVDECCEKHNECYDASRSACGSVSPNFVYYSYRCDGQQAQTTCKDSIHSCAGYVCNCDKSMMDCLKKYPRPQEGNIPKCHLTAASAFRHSNISHEA
ncbi:hypothetical protein PMAYCL1PPCAC_18746, partial [Pristionchus mayeri]